MTEKDCMLTRILCIGDIVGQAGRTFLSYALPILRKRYALDLIIANAENAAGGSGITPTIFKKLQSYGVDVVTLGDHCYRREDIIPFMQESDRIVRPANLPASAAGKPFVVVQARNSQFVGVSALLGRLYMKPVDCPFRAADKVLSEINKQTKIAVIDMHAEATSEKVAMGWYLDGRVSIVFGTHTHVPTADARILPKGTAYITDLGMTGPYDSVLGRTKEKVVKSLISGMPTKYSIAKDDIRVAGIIVSVDSISGRATDIEQIIADKAAIERLRQEIKQEEPSL